MPLNAIEGALVALHTSTFPITSTEYLDSIRIVTRMHYAAPRQNRMIKQKKNQKSNQHSTAGKSPSGDSGLTNNVKKNLIAANRSDDSIKKLMTYS